MLSVLETVSIAKSFCKYFRLLSQFSLWWFLSCVKFKCMIVGLQGEMFRPFDPLMSTKLCCIMYEILFFTVKVFVQHIYWMLSSYFGYRVQCFGRLLCLCYQVKVWTLCCFSHSFLLICVCDPEVQICFIWYTHTARFYSYLMIEVEQTSEAVCFVTKTRWRKISKICVS